MKKRALWMPAAAFALVMALSACGGKGGESAPSGGSSAGPSQGASAPASPSATQAERFDVSLRHIQIGEAQKFRKAILDEVVKKTEAEVPGLVIQMDGVEDSFNRWTKLPAEMAAGNPPKIFDVFGGPGDALKYARAGKMLDVTPILDELGIKDKFTDYSTFVLDGKIYGLPIGASSEGWFYNKDLLAKYGISVPKTLEELEAAFDKLKQNGVTPIAMGSQAAWVPNMIINTLIARYAGPDFNFQASTGAKKWNDPAVVAAYAKYQEWEKKGYFTKGELGIDYAGQTNEFIAGKAAFLFDGTWRISSFQTGGIGEALAGKVGYFPFPAVPNGVGDQTAVNYNQNNGYGFSADLNDREKTAVKAFIKNLYTDEYQIRGFKEDKVLPSMKVDPSQLTTDDPIMKQVLETDAAAQSVFPHFDSLVPSKVNTETETQLQNLIAGKATPQEAADAIQKVLEAELAAIQ